MCLHIFTVLLRNLRYKYDYFIYILRQQQLNNVNYFAVIYKILVSKEKYCIFVVNLHNIVKY